MFACLYTPGALCPSLDDFSPRTERLDDSTVLLDASGLSRIWPSWQHLGDGLKAHVPHAHVCLAATAHLALELARCYEGLTIVPAGDEEAYLLGLPLDVLPASEETKDTLHEWGLSTLSDLVQLPEIAVVERLGQQGLLLRTWALGQTRRLFQPDGEERKFRAHLTLEDPIENLEPLRFILSRLLHDVCGQLSRDGWATNELRLDLELESKATDSRLYSLPVALIEPQALLKIMQIQLDARPPRMAVVKVLLEAQPAKRRVLQKGFFIPPPPEPDKLEFTLSRLMRLVGPEHFGSPVILDTHRPDAWELRRFPPAAPNVKQPALSMNSDRECKLALRYYRPAIPARVALMRERPSWVDASSVRGRVVRSAGPWRRSGDWWKLDTTWERQEWDVELETGSIYRLYESPGSGWFVDGYYD